MSNAMVKFDIPSFIRDHITFRQESFFQADIDSNLDLISNAIDQKNVLVILKRKQNKNRPEEPLAANYILSIILNRIPPVKSPMRSFILKMKC